MKILKSGSFFKQDILFILFYILSRAIQSFAYQSLMGSYNMTLDDLNRMDNDGFIFTYLFLNIIPLAVLSFFLYFVWKSPRSIMGNSLKNFGKNSLSGFLLGLLIVILFNGINLFLGTYNFLGVSNTFFPPYIMVYLIGFAIQVLHIELLLRGYVFHQLQKWVSVKYKLPMAIIFTSLVSVILHIYSSPYTLFSNINSFLMAMLLCFFVIDSKDLWLATGFHLGWNYLQAVFFSHNVNGYFTNTTFLHLDGNRGMALFSGGGAGPIGSIVTTGILLLLLLLYGIKIAQKKKENKIS